jgi:catalase
VIKFTGVIRSGLVTTAAAFTDNECKSGPMYAAEKDMIVLAGSDVDLFGRIKLYVPSRAGRKGLMARIGLGPTARDHAERLAQSTTRAFTADDGPLLAKLAGEAQAKKRGNALRAGLRPVHTCGVFVKGQFLPTGNAGSAAPAHLRGTEPLQVIARFSSCDSGKEMDDRHMDPRGLAVRFLLANGRSTDLVSMSTDCFPVTTLEDFQAVSGALSRPQPVRCLRAGVLAMQRRFRSPFTFLTTFAPASYAHCDYHALHTFVWSNGTTQPVRYRWRAVAGRKRTWPWTRLFKSKDYLRQDLDQKLKDGVRFRLEVQYANGVKESRLRDIGRPLPRGVPWRDVGALRLHEIVSGIEEKELEKLVFSPAHLIDGIEPYPGDEIFVARAAAYPASHVIRSCPWR